MLVGLQYSICLVLLFEKFKTYIISMTTEAALLINAIHE